MLVDREKDYRQGSVCRLLLPLGDFDGDSSFVELCLGVAFVGTE